MSRKTLVSLAMLGIMAASEEMRPYLKRQRPHQWPQQDGGKRRRRQRRRRRNKR